MLSGRGQKHQRREKQEQHLKEAEQLCNSTLGALLDGPDTLSTQSTDEQSAESLKVQLPQLEQAHKEAAPEGGEQTGASLEATDGGEALAEDAAEEGSGSGIVVQRGRAAGAGSCEEEVEFQGCGVPSAFADPASFVAAASDGEGDGDAHGDSLGALPRRTLTLRPSGMRVSLPPASQAANAKHCHPS